MNSHIHKTQYKISKTQRTQLHAFYYRNTKPNVDQYKNINSNKPIQYIHVRFV